MRTSAAALRRAALVTIAVASVLWALFLVWRLASREQIAWLSTAHLMAILALILLPGATWLAWRLERGLGAAAAPADGRGGQTGSSGLGRRAFRDERHEHPAAAGGIPRRHPAHHALGGRGRGAGERVGAEDVAE